MPTWISSSVGGMAMVLASDLIINVTGSVSPSSQILSTISGI